MIRLGLPVGDNSSDELTKAFSAGPKAFHKYWRRVRVMHQGKLGWRYYYNTPEDRQRYLEDRKKRRKQKHPVKAPELSHLSDEEVADVFHVDKAGWHDHFPEFKAERAPATSLTPENVFGPAGFVAPKVTLDGNAQAFANEIANQTEPEDLWCQPMHPMRALESAVKMLPKEISARFPDVLKSVEFYGTKQDATKAQKIKVPKRTAAWCDKGSGRITLPLDTTTINARRPHKEKDYTVHGGNRPIHIILHEWGHCIAHAMQKNQGAGPNWADWTAIKGFTGRGKEKGITAYAETDLEERFCESFGAALLTPVQLAEQCPKAYDFMHRLMPSAVPPRAEIMAMDFPADQVAKFVNPWFKATDAPLTIAQRIVADIPEPGRAADVYRVDPPDPDKIGKQGNADRFYEMNHRGRTVFFRYGMQNADDVEGGKSTATWEPSTERQAASEQVLPKVSQIKEAFDERGNPIDPAYAYLHLIQDEIKDDTVITVDGKTKITMQYIRDNGGLSSKDPKIAKLFSASSGSMTMRYVLRSMAKGSIHAKLAKLADLHMQARKATGAARTKIEAEIAKLEKEAAALDLKSQPDRAAGKSFQPVPLTMVPHEVSATEFRQRSGCFNYDNFEVEGQALIERLQATKPGSAEELALLDEFAEKYPGTLSLKDRRWPKGSKAKDPVTGKQVSVGGRFRKGTPYVEKDPVTGKRRPAMRKKTYVMANPDGSKTRIETFKGSDGRYRIQNQMWAKLLTPNGEEVNSAEHLVQLAKVAARNRRRAWLSVKTDRPRRRGKGGRMEVDPTGDVDRHMHVEVEFDGAGPPRLVGENWKKKLGADTPRIDHLIKKDPLGESVNWARDRNIIPAEQITLSAPEKPSGLPNNVGDRVVLTTRTLDWKGKTDRGGREVVARLIRYVAGKEAGEIPAPPGWDRMPEGVPNLEREVPAGLAGKLSPKMKSMISQGLLPEWYTHTPTQREWYNTHFIPAYTAWDETKEAETAKSYDPVYVFAGEVGMGGGSNVFRRVGDADVLATTRFADEAPTPERLSGDPLVYLHKFMDPRTGETMASEPRILLPRDNSVVAEELMNIPGVRVHKKKVGSDEDATEVVTHITLTLEAFPALRRKLGTLSLTGDITTLLEQRVAMLKAAEKQREQEAHQVELGQIDPAWMRDNWGAGLNKTLPNGAAFTLADHQQRGVQKLFDNDLRCLFAHFMGCGKTVAAIASIKMAMARPMRQGVEPGQGIPDDLVGADREKWLADHPFIPGTRDPRNPTRCLIVAPLNTVEQWRQAASDFDDGAIVVGAGDNDIPIDDFVEQIKSGAIAPDMVVVGPQYFTQHAKKLKECGFDGLVIDEVHQGIKNESAERNKVVKEWNSDMKMLLLLTGTPITTSPSDVVEYVNLLSEAKQWAGMTKKAFTEEYLEKTPLPEEMGVQGVSSPKLRVKPEKRAELAAILAQWMDIALPKHVKGKVLPAVRIEDQKTSEMTGAQLAAYNLYMATVSNLGAETGLSSEELNRLGPDAKKQSLAAKGVMDCVGYKPGGADPYMTIEAKTLDNKGEVVTTKKVFTTPNPEYLFSKKDRGNNAGRWPLIDELEGEDLAAKILDENCLDVLGMPYAELAGKPIGYGFVVPGLDNPLKIPPTKEQVKGAKKAMVDAGWVGGKKIENADAGEIGIRFRGDSVSWDADLQDQIDKARKAGDNARVKSLQGQLTARGQRLSEASDVQRAYRHALRYGVGRIPSEDLGKHSQFEILAEVAREYEISFSEAQELVHISPRPFVAKAALTTTNTGGYGKVTVTTKDEYVSDRTGSLHLLYAPEDWDEQAKQPKTSTAAFADLKDNSLVRVDAKALAQVGIVKPKIPAGLTKEQRDAAKAELADWGPPPLRLALGEPRNAKGEVAVRRTDTSEIVYVPEKAVTGIVASLMDPGRRMDRVKADIAMTHGNAKAAEVRRVIEQFHDGSGPGPDGERQMVLFANSILTGCRTLEAQVRLMGYRDVNEVIEGSPLFDPEDPTTIGGTSPNGKTFVTYIGSTYTGDREQNVLIFKKVKDTLGRDSKTSLFVHMNMEPRAAESVKVNGEFVPVDWMVYRGDTGNDYLPDGVDAIQMSQFSPEQRETARATLGIDPPESYVIVAGEKRYFYGASVPSKLKKQLLDQFGKEGDKFNTTGDLLSAIARTPDPSKIEDPKLAEQMRKRIAGLKAAYSDLAAANSTMDPPLNGKQISAFNNCELIICSDAAQVGMNLGNASEMIMYDSLGSPMAEWQRMTRCARLLPEAVSRKLLGKPIMEKVKVPKRDKQGNVVMQNGKPVMVDKQTVNPETGKLETVMVQKRDENGRFQYETTGAAGGIIDAIREMEPELFATEDRAMTQATVSKVKLSGFRDEEGGKAEASAESALEKRMAATDALDVIASQADLLAERSRNRKTAKDWEAIAAQARTARNQGGLAARQQLLKFKDMPSPSTGEPLISFPATALPPYDPTAGTYAKVDTKSAEAAIRKAYDKLDDNQRQAILDSGFQKAEPPNVGSPDFAGLYLAIRAQEILTWVDTMRPVVSAEMKDQVGGAEVTDEEVMNRIIDTMSPTDRAILKEKKYLVNVRKIKASGAIGQTQKHSYKVVDEEGKMKSVTDKVSTGYEQEYPVKAEVRTQVLGRARTVSNEQILTDVQRGVEFKPDVEFDLVSSRDFTSASMTKAIRLVLDLGWRPFDPLDLVKGG